jgi:thiamine biosynthesis lipoprotein
MLAGHTERATESRLRLLMGTFIAVEATSYDAAAASRAIDAAFVTMQRVERLMHPSGIDSDLSKLGNAVVGEPIAVDPWTREVLSLARAMHDGSGGLFDPCLATAPGRIPDLDIRDAHIVCRARVEIDLGGIAKGFAVDVAIEELRREGCEAGLVNAGGDLRMFGPVPRTIELRRPGGASVELTNTALAVSAPRSAESPPQHRGFYAGDSGRIVEGHDVAIIAPAAAVADALCKCAILCDSATLAKLLEHYGARRVAD